MKTAIYQVDGGYSVKFSLLSQHFNLMPTPDKKSSKFLARMLRKGIKTNYEDIIHRQQDIIHTLQVKLNDLEQELLKP
jgi:hypothetical protein